MVYKFKKSSRVKADANKIMQEINSQDGFITPEKYVDFARDPSTEAHKTITWDDSEAAMKWRLDEARHVIRSIVIVQDDTDMEPVRVFASITVDHGTERSYVPADVFLNDAVMLSEVVDDIKKGIDELVRKLRGYEILADDLKCKGTFIRAQDDLKKVKDLFFEFGMSEFVEKAL